MDDLTPFYPYLNASVSVTTAAGLVVSAIPVDQARGYSQMLITNDSTSTVWIAFGDSSAITTANGASGAGIPVLAGSAIVITMQGTVYAAVYSTGANGKVWFTPGSGF